MTAISRPLKAIATFWAMFYVLMTAANYRTVAAQQLNSEDRSRAHIMLNAIKDDLKKNYYAWRRVGIQCYRTQRN